MEIAMKHSIARYIFLGSQKPLLDFSEQLKQIVKNSVYLINEKDIAFNFGIENVPCKGNIVDIYDVCKENGGLFSFFVKAEEPFPSVKLFDAILQKHFAGLINYELQFDDPVYNHFFNTDIGGRFFTARYHINIITDGTTIISNGFDNMKQVEEYVFEISKKHIHFDTMDEVDEFFKDRPEWCEVGEYLSAIPNKTDD